LIRKISGESGRKKKGKKERSWGMGGKQHESFAGRGGFHLTFGGKLHHKGMRFEKGLRRTK